jgi:hypothetical protein
LFIVFIIILWHKYGNFFPKSKQNDIFTW